ncbi:hypothetical protein L1887_53599 [Cichorium endivia]|nr:hypothetical protein L1887_53599 [Cichorium endivia]
MARLRITMAAQLSAMPRWRRLTWFRLRRTSSLVDKILQRRPRPNRYCRACQNALLLGIGKSEDERLGQLGRGDEADAPTRTADSTDPLYQGRSSPASVCSADDAHLSNESACTIVVPRETTILRSKHCVGRYQSRSHGRKYLDLAISQR